MTGQVIIICAMSEKNLIGNDDKIPWHVPEDFKFFRETTMGCPMIMGRVTRETFGENPLKGRPHLVVSRDKNYSPKDSFVFETPESALIYAKENFPAKNIYIIGGSQIYQSMLHLANKLLISKISGQYEGNKFFPNFNENDYQKKIILDLPNIKIPFTVWEYIKKL